MTAQLGKTLIVLIQHLTDSAGEVDNIVQWSWSAGSYELSDHALTRSSSNYELFFEKQENKVYFVKKENEGGHECDNDVKTLEEKKIFVNTPNQNASYFCVVEEMFKIVRSWKLKPSKAIKGKKERSVLKLTRESSSSL